MKAKVRHLTELLHQLSEKTKQPQNTKGFKSMSDELSEGITENYLYKNIYNAIQKKKKEDVIGLRDGHLNEIASFLGFKNYEKFIESLDGNVEPQLLSCVGDYYSYVRRNSEKGALFRSPVKIWEENKKVRFELRGPTLMFGGEIQLRHGCLFILMEAKEGKAFHHVYKIGKREKPKVLQGTFSRVSTAFDPIGGRTLIRTDEAYNQLTNAQLDVEKIKKSRALAERRLARYFQEYRNNNVSPNKSSTFGLDDLGDCK